jgi:hypothetical protein
VAKLLINGFEILEIDKILNKLNLRNVKSEFKIIWTLIVLFFCSFSFATMQDYKKVDERNENVGTQLKKDSSYFYTLKDHIGEQAVSDILSTKRRYDAIKSNSSFIPSLSPYGYSWSNAGFTKQQNDSVSTVLNRLYLIVYDVIKKRDVVRYPHANAQKGYVEFYDSIVSQINRLSSDYVDIQNLSLIVHNDLNQFILFSIGPDKWYESTIDFSSITYNCSITSPIDSNAEDGLANHIQLTSLNFFYNESQQLELDIDISLETGQRILEAHYVAGFCNAKTRKKVKKNPEKRVEEYPYKKCFCDGEDYCPISFLLVKYNTYPVSLKLLFQVGSGFPNYFAVDKIQNIEQNFELLYNAYRGEELSVSGVELVPTSWEKVWYPDGRLYSRKFYSTPYFAEQGEYGKPSLSGMAVDSGSAKTPNVYSIYLDQEFTINKIYFTLGEVNFIQQSSDSCYYTLNRTFIKDSSVWLEFLSYCPNKDSNDTLFVNTHENIGDIAIIIFIFGPEHVPGIQWPFSYKNLRKEEENLYHIFDLEKDDSIIFFPIK